jgi:rhodanese-related sulfurtransferase
LHTTITTEELRQNRETGSQLQLVDVRSASEYAAGHVPGAANIPLEQIEARLEDLDPSRSLVLICQSGKRACMTADLLAPHRSGLNVLDGGTEAWVKAGLPVVRSTKVRWALERQLRLVAGVIVLVGAVLALAVNVRWAFLSGFVGLGLTLAGLTDFCPMGILLARMPWNRAGKPLPAGTDTGKQVCGL